MTAEILSVGTEILLGDIVNTNAREIARALSSLGIDVYYQTVVGDNPKRLDEALSLAKSRADIIITSGGLGPTTDDLTKETIAKNFNREMVLNEDALKSLEAFFQNIGHKMPEENLKQAYFPKDSLILENPNGTAPGCILKGDDGKFAVMMPGPPREMAPMLYERVVPYFKEYSSETILSKELRIIGIGEPTIEKMLKNLTERDNPTVAPYAKDGECVVRVTAKAKAEEEALSLINPTIEIIKERLGDNVYGIDIPAVEHAVLALLKEKGQTVAFAESCTGGLLSKRLTDIPGSSEVFPLGLVTYTEKQKHDLLHIPYSTFENGGVVSPKCALLMAKAVRQVGGTDFGLSSTGFAGPGGGTKENPVGTCYLAVHDGKKGIVGRFYMPRARDFVRTAAATKAFDMLRRALLYLK